MRSNINSNSKVRQKVDLESEADIEAEATQSSSNDVDETLLYSVYLQEKDEFDDIKKRVDGKSHK